MPTFEMTMWKSFNNLISNGLLTFSTPGFSPGIAAALS